jgi:DNA primase
MASGDAVQQIKDRLNIIDVISPYAELTRSGRHFVARCPFHQEKSPSFHVSPERGTYHCFGCGVGGDIFSFIQAIDGVEFKDALKTLAEKAGVELVPENPQKKTERDELVAVIEAATTYYENQLPNKVEAVQYLERRGVTKETIKKWRIGYAPGPPVSGWRELKTHLATEKFLPGVMLKAGLIKSTEGGKEPFDTFRDRIMFPLRDQAGRVVGFSGRILAKDTEAPKYVNSPETELYHKSELLYGYDMAKQGIRNLGFWIIVEGQFDVVMSHQAGYTNTVAVSGTALTVHHVQLLERLSNKVVLALDSDKAGIAAMKKSADLMLRRGIDVKVAAMPDGADPADMILEDAKSFKTAVGHATHIIEFLLAHLRKETTDDRAYKLKATAEVMPFITLIPNMVDRDHFEGVTATALGTTKEAVHAEVLRLLEEQKRAPAQYKEPAAQITETTKVTTEHVTAILRKEGTLHYLLAAMTVVPLPVKEVLEREVAAIVGMDVLSDEQINGSSHISKLTFQIEQFIEKSSYRLQIEEFTHKLNQLHKLTVEGKLAHEKAQLREIEASGEGDTMPVLLRVNELRRLLQANEYQPSIFPKL